MNCQEQILQDDLLIYQCLNLQCRSKINSKDKFMRYNAIILQTEEMLIMFLKSLNRQNYREINNFQDFMRSNGKWSKIK